MNKTTKARKYTSIKLQSIFDEITPVEMEKTRVKMLLAARIEDLMRAKGFTNSQFAEKVGKSPSEVTKWLSGTQNLTIDILTEIAFALNVPVAALFGRKPEQIVYRNEIIINAVVTQPSIILTTPTSNKGGLYGKFILRKNQRVSIPIKNSFQA